LQEYIYMWTLENHAFEKLFFYDCASIYIVMYVLLCCNMVEFRHVGQVRPKARCRLRPLVSWICYTWTSCLPCRRLHFSSINEDLLLYWLMVHFSSEGVKSMSATWESEDWCLWCLPSWIPQSSLINKWRRWCIIREMFYFVKDRPLYTVSLWITHRAEQCR